MPNCRTSPAMRWQQIDQVEIKANV